MNLKWRFGAAHVGDCAVFISYDVAETDLAKQKYFKIANLPDCRAQNNQEVQITLPSWLPAGDAIMRWDWTALHVYPRVEFYSQCSDITITSNSATSPADIESYSIISPPIYPSSGSDGVGYRNPFNPSSPQYITGKACANGFKGNNCELTAEGTQGSTGGGSADGGDTDGGDTDGGDGEEPTPLCLIHTVSSGETLASIATYYVGQGYESVTWQNICSENNMIDCNSIDVGDTYIIPGTCTAGFNNDNDGEEDKDKKKTSTGVVLGSLFFVGSVVTVLAVYWKRGGKAVGAKFWGNQKDNTMV